MGRDLNARLDKSISTSALNKLIGDMWEHRPPAKLKERDSRSFMRFKSKTDLLESNFFVIENIN